MESFIAAVSALVDSSSADEHELTEQVAVLLAELLASGYRLPAEFTRPGVDRHVNYPLHIAADDRWSLVSVVWNPGQRTPVHGHEMWGVAGIYAGAEREFRYLKPAAGSSGPLVALGENVWERGQVTVCCTTDDDVHAVEAVGTEPTIGIHVYGGNIGTAKRRLYDPATGAVEWFTSGWDTPPTG